jgi:hypothetical protein
MRQRALRLGLALLWWAAPACGVTGDAADAGIDLVDAPFPFDRQRDSSDDACVEGCHWDCFGGSLCEDGEVYVVGYGAVYCCGLADPWPYGGPACSITPAWTQCTEPKCAVPDPRYGACLMDIQWDDLTAQLAGHLLRLYCEENGARAPGDPCTLDADCRPVAEGTTARLRCDSVTSTCVGDERPPTPATFGQPCGLDASEYERELTAGVTCELCHTYWDSTASCLAQACTMPCQFDEDCPGGAVCVCGRWPLWSDAPPYYQFCAVTTDRFTAAGRAQALSCG